MSLRNKDLVERYVRFIFSEWEADKSGWITKRPPSVGEFATHWNCEPTLCDWWHR